MRRILFRLFTSISCFLFVSEPLISQGFSWNCMRDTVLLGCSPNACITLQGIIPDIRGLSNTYTLNPTSSNPGCLPVYVQPDDPNGSPTALTVDDTYSGVITIGFPFPFYGTIYNSLIASTNGFLSFDISKAGMYAHWPIPPGGDLPSTSYDRAEIMGPNHDLYPGQPTSPSQRIQYQVWGTAPHRRWILSYFKVPLFSCTSLIENTHQIILYESTGIIEVAIFSKQICGTWNGGRSIVGIQDFNRTSGMMAPNRAASSPPWGSIGMNESWRFVPNSGPSLFRRVELYDITGNFLVTGTTINLGNGCIQASFPNICAPGGVITSYLIKSFYTKIDDPLVEIWGTDTVRIDRTNAVLTANTSSTGTSCSGASNGSITITPTNGAAPYTYILDGGAPQTGGSPFTFNNVPAGSHSVVVTDASNCTLTINPITISAGPALTTTVNKTDALCNGAASGTITVTQPTMGTPPYQYSLDGTNWQSSNTFTGLAAGTYTVYYRESNGCQNSQPVTIAEPSAMSASATTTPALCNGQSNGIITVTSGGGIAPHQYSIDGVNFQASNTFNVPAGTYTVTIRDGNNCTSTRSVTVTQPAALSANSSNTNASCDGGNDGIITVTANGGNTSYTYSIDGINFQASNIFNVAPGNYTITVKDNLGCIATFTTTVGLTSNLSMIRQNDVTICEGSSTQLQLNSNATQYVWTPATGLSSTSISNPVANPTVTTQYFVTATLARCSAEDTVIVNVNAAPIPNAGPDGFICYGQSYQLQASGGTQFNWTPSNYLSSTAISNPVATPSKTYTYTLSVIDGNGCNSLITDDVTVDVTPPIKISTFPYDTIGYPGDQFQLLAIPSDSSATIYNWSPGTGLTDTKIPNPVVTVGNIGNDVLYQVIVSNAAGCRGEGYIMLRVYKGPDIYVPTGFTPNNDGRNDKFYPFPVGIKKINYFRVFNRWGQLVYFTTVLDQGWDGTFSGKEQGSGVYVWMAEAVSKDDRLITKQGTVTLIR